jgi:hypothetical protein
MPPDDRTRRSVTLRGGSQRAYRALLAVTIFFLAGLLAMMTHAPLAVSQAATETKADKRVAPTTEELPAGYVTQVDAAVHWTYPVAADDEVRALRATQAATWRRITEELGTVVDPGLDIRVARNPEEMRALVSESTPLPGYADGIAFPESGLVLLTLTDPDTFLRPDLHTVLAHELSHVALYRAVGGASVPRWFAEGVAVQQSEESSFSRFRTLWEGAVRGGVLDFERLTRGFPARRDEVDIAYAQSSDFVAHMLTGKEERARFRALLEALRGGTEFSSAIESAYHVPLSYMEREWRADLQQRFGRWPMFMMGLTSLWVLGAVLVVIAYLRARARNRATIERWEQEERTAMAATAALTLPVSSLVDSAPSSTPTGAVQSSLDDFFDNRHAKHEAGVPTVVHDGRSHTLH